jgi:hypothetical protein
VLAVLPVLVNALSAMTGSCASRAAPPAGSITS